MREVRSVERQDAIVRDPNILEGEPVFAGTRVPAQTLIDYLKDGHSLEDFLLGFPSVSREQAHAVLDAALEKIRTAHVKLDAETVSWLSANLSGALPDYEWGEAGVPRGEAVEYDPDMGLIVIEEDEA